MYVCMYVWMYVFDDTHFMPKDSRNDDMANFAEADLSKTFKKVLMEYSLNWGRQNDNYSKRTVKILVTYQLSVRNHGKLNFLYWMWPMDMISW